MTLVEEMISEKNAERKERFTLCLQNLLIARAARISAVSELRTAERAELEAEKEYNKALRDYALIACGLPEHCLALSLREDAFSGQ
jgi:hypothetical protein